MIPTPPLAQRSPRPFRLGPAAMNVVVFIVFALLLLLYLAQSTQSASRQYDIRKLEDQLGSLQTDREQLELEAIRLESLTTIAPPPESTEPDAAPPSDHPESLIPPSHSRLAPTATIQAVNRASDVAVLP
jgi:hypothetical protein